MKFLALVVFFLQISQPANTANNVQKNAAAQQQPAAPSLAVKNPYSSPTDNHTGNQPPNADNHVTVIVQQPTSVSGWEKAYVILTGLLVVAAAIGAGYAIKTLRAVERQSKATEDQLIQTQKAFEFSRDTVRASERADVLIDAASIVPAYVDGQVDGDARLKVRFKNFGRTRAKDVRFQIEMMLPGLPSVQLAQGKTELPVMVLGPGQDQSITFQSFREFLTQQTFRQIMQGDVELSFQASASYNDVFGSGYLTMDIGVYDPRAKTFRIVQKIAG